MVSMAKHQHISTFHRPHEAKVRAHGGSQPPFSAERDAAPASDGLQRPGVGSLTHHHDPSILPVTLLVTLLAAPIRRHQRVLLEAQLLQRETLVGQPR